MLNKIALAMLATSLAFPAFAEGEVNVYSSRQEQLIKPLLDIPAETVPLFQGYMADIAHDPQQGILACSSPRGNHTTVWSTHERRFLHAWQLPEPSGIAFLAEEQAFLVSDATGGLHRLPSSPQQQAAQTLYQFANVSWDNHLLLA